MTGSATRTSDLLRDEKRLRWIVDTLRAVWGSGFHNNGFLTSTNHDDPAVQKEALERFRKHLQFGSDCFPEAAQLIEDLLLIQDIPHRAAASEKVGAYWLRRCEKSEAQRDEARREVERLQAERDAARRWAGRWKAIAKVRRESDQATWQASERVVGQISDQLAALRSAVLKALQGYYATDTCTIPGMDDLERAYFASIRIQAGDSVKHGPTGETWFVLGVDGRGGKVCVAGWPPTIAELADCTLVEAGNGITDREREYRDAHFGRGWDDEVAR